MARELKTRGTLKKKQNSFHDEAETTIRMKHDTKCEVQVEINYGDEFPMLVIKRDKKVIHEGPWTSAVYQHGTKLSYPDEACSLTCSSSDSDGDYAEFCRGYETDLQIDYSVFLARKYPFMVLACFSNQPQMEGASLESVLPPVVEKLNGKSMKKREWQAGETTRDLILDGVDDWRLFPINVPQFRTRNNGCQLEYSGQNIIQRTEPGSLPLAHLSVITWEPQKAKYPTTWKQVEVGFGTKPVSMDQAVAWRFRIGKEQFLYYRSFVQMIQPRSALGLHTNYECVISTINKDGFHRALMSIEREDRK